ncbi:MAG TPA: methyltransferase domain-containing protein [Mycobacteriales bacterium]|nr:methyltransferase domain-containing protein [Mycobacteriales bacterium]
MARRLANYDNPRSIGSRIRARRIGFLLGLIKAAHASNGKVDVLDVGGTRAYWDVLPAGTMDRYDVRVTIVNLPGLAHPADDGRFRYVEADGCALPYPDHAFDIASSNSVIEHVGDWVRMREFAEEIRRTARLYVVQTPYFWFPIEPHFMAPMFHWLPEQWRFRLLLHLRLGHAGRSGTVDEAVRRVQSARLVDRTMLRSLFPDGDLHAERMLGLPKSLIVTRSAG